MFDATSLIVKIIGSIGAVSAGLDLGKEGPLVHIGTCIASLLAQGGPDNYRIKWSWIRYFNNDKDRRDLITCHASSGVCAAFRAPVVGVLFALEEVAAWWRSALLWRTFFSTAVVVMVLRAFIEICNSGICGLFGTGGLIMFDVGDSFNPSIYEIILELKGLPFLDANPETWMRNLTVGELAHAKRPVITRSRIEKVSRIVEVPKNTTHNAFPVIDDGVVPPTGLATRASELHGLILRAHLVQALKKKWFLLEKRTEWEVREKFSWVELAESEGKIEGVSVTCDEMEMYVDLHPEMEMYVDLHPLTNTTLYMVMESMSVAKA